MPSFREMESAHLFLPGSQLGEYNFHEAGCGWHKGDIRSDHLQPPVLTAFGEFCKTHVCFIVHRTPRPPGWMSPFGHTEAEVRGSDEWKAE